MFRHDWPDGEDHVRGAALAELLDNLSAALSLRLLGSLLCGGQDRLYCGLGKLDLPERREAERTRLETDDADVTTTGGESRQGLLAPAGLGL